MKEVRRIALVGPRGAGKTTLALEVGRALGWPVLDTDDLLAVEVGESAGSHLARVGEAAFRAVEERVTCGALAAPGPVVLALGGGAVLSEAVREALRPADLLVVFATAAPRELQRRLALDPTLRPPLTGLSQGEEVVAILRQRLPLYREVADLELDTGENPVADCAGRILAAVARGRP